VAPREIAKNQDSAELLEKFTDMAKELLYQGKTKDELISIIDTLYKGGKADGND
jgi:hypothetical protein